VQCISPFRISDASSLSRILTKHKINARNKRRGYLTLEPEAANFLSPKVLTAASSSS
jgi:hypothetical protein